MVRDGQIALEEVIRIPGRRRHAEEIVLLEEDSGGKIEAALGSLSSRKKKVRLLLEALRDRAAAGAVELPLKELLASTGVSSATAREVLRTGLVSSRRQEIQSEEVIESPPSITLNIHQQEALEKDLLATLSGRARNLLAPWRDRKRQDAGLYRGDPPVYRDWARPPSFLSPKSPSRRRPCGDSRRTSASGSASSTAA